MASAPEPTENQNELSSADHPTKPETPTQPATDWKGYLGKRLLCQTLGGTNFFDATVIDVATNGQAVRLAIGEHLSKEWVAAGNVSVVQELNEPGLIDLLQIRLHETEGINKELNKQVVELTERLNAALADNVIKTNSLEPLIGKVVAANNLSNQYNANFEAERTKHELTKQELGNTVTDRDNARGELDMEQKAHRNSIRTLTDRAVSAETDPDLLAMREVKQIAKEGVTVEISHPSDAPNLDASTVVTVWNGDTPTAVQGRSVKAALARLSDPQG